MLEGLNKGLPRLGVGKSSKVKGHMESLQDRDENKNGGCLDGVAKEKVGCCGGGNKGGCSKEEGQLKRSLAVKSVGDYFLHLHLI